MPQKIKVLVVDDSATFRKAISNVLAEDPDIEVVGVAPDGSLALKKIEQLNPDIVTLDIEMPVMDGLTALREINKAYPSVSVIMFSVHTERGAEKTIEALTLGAADFVTKHSGSGSFEANLEIMRQDLLSKIKGCKASKKTEEIKKAPLPFKPHVLPMRRDVIAIGSSTGGPNALLEIIPKFPKAINSAILIVQHMPPIFTEKLAQHLNAKSEVEVREGKEGDAVEPGVALIAPGGYHMVVKKTPEGKMVISLNQNAMENHCRPSVDVLFRSVAEHYGPKSVGIILTGMGRDGFEGVKLMKEKGAPIIAQNKETCVVWGMPRFVVEAGLAASEVPISMVAQEVSQFAV